MIHPQVYGLDGVTNMRDLGGYPAQNGGKTATGRFIRSTALAGLAPGGEDRLRALGVDCVIDLRSSYERKTAPDVIENSDTIHFAHIPMLDYISSNVAAGDIAHFPSSMPEMYIGLLEHSKKDFNAVFRLFADERFGGCLFHCTAGKDRTGVTAMLLLGLAGVDEELIIEDYAYTERLLPSAPIRADAAGLPRYLFEAKPETMRAALGHIRKKYGGVTDYLEEIGVVEDVRRRVLNKLIEGQAR